MTQHEPRDVRVVPLYEVDTLGAPFEVLLHESVSLSVDLTTGEELVSIPDVVGLMNAVVRTRVSHPRKLNGSEVKFIRHSLGLKAKDLAEFLDISPEHLSRCENETKVLSASAEKLFRLYALFATFFKDPENLLSSCMNTENLTAKSKKPNEMVDSFVSMFLTMKIDPIFDPSENLSFTFSRRVGSQSDFPGEDDFDNGEWSKEPALAAA